MYSKEMSKDLKTHGLGHTGKPKKVEEFVAHEIAQAYADQFFDFLEPLKTDRNLQDLLERNQFLSAQADERVNRLKEALAANDQHLVCRMTQDLFDCMGRLGDVRMMRVCYRILMQSRSGNLKAARRLVPDLDSEYDRLRGEVLGFHLH